MTSDELLRLLEKAEYENSQTTYRIGPEPLFRTPSSSVLISDAPFLSRILATHHIQSALWDAHDVGRKAQDRQSMKLFMDLAPHLTLLPSAAREAALAYLKTRYPDALIWQIVEAGSTGGIASPGSHWVQATTVEQAIQTFLHHLKATPEEYENSGKSLALTRVFPVFPEMIRWVDRTLADVLPSRTPTSTPTYLGGCDHGQHRGYPYELPILTCP